MQKYHYMYRKVTSTSLSCLEPHAGFFRLSMKRKFHVYLLLPFGKKLISYKHTLILAPLLYARDVMIIKMAAQVVSTHTAIPYAHPSTDI